MKINDPTFQTDGSLLASIRNETNFTFNNSAYNKWTGISVNPNSPTYLPTNSPPPPWTAGKDYYPYPGMAYQFGSVLPTQYGQYAQGAATALKIQDMSAQAVKAGKAYFFTVDTPLTGAEPTVRIIWTITGVSGGSTLVPGFGLYNLIHYPNTWTYMSPPAFTGEFSLDLANPNFIEAVTLSVSYLPRRDMVGFYSSCLNFRIGGSLYGTSTPKTADEPEHPVVQEILAASADYKLSNVPA